MGCEDVLLLSRCRQPLPDHGVLAGGRHDDAPHEEGYTLRRLHTGMRDPRP